MTPRFLINNDGSPFEGSELQTLCISLKHYLNFSQETSRQEIVWSRTCPLNRWRQIRAAAPNKALNKPGGADNPIATARPTWMRNNLSPRLRRAPDGEKHGVI